MSIEALQRAVDLAGGQSALAAAIGSGKKQQHVWAWLNRDLKVPAEMVLPIVRAVGGAVTPHELDSVLYPDPNWMPSGLGEAAA